MRLLIILAAVLALVPTAQGGAQRTLITDPQVLAELQARRAEALDKYNNGNPVHVRYEDLPNYTSNPKEKRFLVVAGLAGVALIEAFGAGARGRGGIFTKEDQRIWHSEKNCRTHFKTHAGDEEVVRTYDRGSTDRFTDADFNVGWNDPENTDPHVHFFTDPAIGRFSVQFTATDSVAWSGTNDTERCYFKGLCNPQYIFYHDKFSAILNTWKSQGDTTACEYTHGDCKGLCYSAITDQFSTNSNVWEGDCAVPCIPDADPDVTTVPNERQKLMIVGDSISHGMEGDWTWRWRLFYWLESQSFHFDFVGPYGGTFGPNPPAAAQPNPPHLPGDTSSPSLRVQGLYASGVPSSFTSSGHAAWWGRQAAQSKGEIQGWVEQYQPDYILVLLGFNDLGWFISGPEGLLASLKELVQNARKGNANVRIFVGNVVHRTFIGGRQDLVDKTNKFNQLLQDAYQSWSTSTSSVSYVDVNANYRCSPDSCPDGWDGLHPNSMGEYHIAEAFARSLQYHFQKDLQHPTEPLSVGTSAEPRVIGTPQNVRTSSLPEGVFTIWEREPQARGYNVRSRLQGMSDWWSDGGVPGGTWALLSTWISEGQTWEFQARTSGDNGDKSAWSPSSFGTAHLKTSPGPSDIIVLPSGAGIMVTWKPVTGYDVNRYGVYVWDLDTEGAYVGVYATTDTSYLATGLNAGHRYGIWVSTYVNLVSSLTGKPVAAGGLPLGARPIIPGAGAPTPPTNLVISNIDPLTARLNWSPSAGAVGYIVYGRAKGDADFSTTGSTTDTSKDVGWLYPGTWYYEFCVSAYNGNMETAHTACAVPPVYPGWKKREEVPANATFISNDTITSNSTGIVNNTQLRALYQQLVVQNYTSVGNGNLSAVEVS
ncbi:hypothetical protein ACEPPN_007459 [Leptodophora sp. 'Broadleaf-Isolate-01']